MLGRKKTEPVPKKKHRIRKAAIAVVGVGALATGALVIGNRRTAGK